MIDSVRPYHDSIDRKSKFVRLIAKRVTTAWPNAGANIGAFAGQSPPTLSQQPCRSSVDGIGSKLDIAWLLEDFFVIGRDLVAMTAMDTYVSGALPHSFLDYLQVPRIIPDKHIRIIDGIISGCGLTGCQLIGGETVEHLPHRQRGQHVSVAGFCIGTSLASADAKQPQIEPGQRLYGWPSYGLACNGFTLVRQIFNLDSGSCNARRYLGATPALLRGKTLGEVLLEPAPIWFHELELERAQQTPFVAHAHITGGGLIDNLPRVLPANCKAKIDRSSWPRPPIFRHIKERGKLANHDMDRVFNQGLMVVSICAGQLIQPTSQICLPIGVIAERRTNEPQVELTQDYQDA